MRNRYMRVVYFVMAGALLLALSACSSPDRENEAAIAAVMKQTWDKPDLPLMVGPIAQDGDAAVADWTQGGAGGRALLKRGASQWSVVLCAGDGIKSEAALQSAGLTAQQSQRIAAGLAEKEKSVPAERLAAMARFKGILRMHASPAGMNGAAGHEGSHH